MEIKLLIIGTIIMLLFAVTIVMAVVSYGRLKREMKRQNDFVIGRMDEIEGILVNEFKGILNHLKINK